jgi:proton/sodium-glutamate symport protein
MKVMIVPLVSISLAMGAASIGDIKKLKRIGTKVLGFYFATTAIAVAIGLFVAKVSGIGKGMVHGELPKGEFKIAEQGKLIDVLLDMVPKNIINAMSDEKMLAIIVFFLLLGVAISTLGDKVKNLKVLLEESNELVLKMVELIMKVAPVGVFALISKVVASTGVDVLIRLLGFVAATLFAFVIHAGVYQVMLITMAKVNPLRFFKKFFNVISVAFSTSSSNATIPINIETLSEKFGVSEEISSFTIPLGATVNMDGTAIMQGVAAVFIANLYNINLGPTQYLGIILTAVLASVGTAGVPGAGMLMLSLVLKQAGLPLEGIGVVIGVDRIIDMFRTAVNITGDAVCTLVVARSENEITDTDKFYN